jgi:hypothetical protein
VIAMNREDAELTRLWNEFHSLVNMPSPVLRDWLLYNPGGVETSTSDPDIDIRTLGERTLEILSKRRVDVTAADTEVMAQVVDEIRELLDNRPADQAGQQAWRETLMTLGHDPIRADASAGSDI